MVVCLVVYSFISYSFDCYVFLCYFVYSLSILRDLIYFLRTFSVCVCEGRFLALSLCVCALARACYFALGLASGRGE